MSDQKQKQPLHVPDQACTTCPYRRDTPPGIWAAEEYEKLREYDEGGGALATWPDGSQHRVPALRTFHCHQSHLTKRDTVCRGWLSVHQDSVAVRVACAYGMLNPDDVPREDEPLYYATGNEAADAGLAGVEDPPLEARHQVDRLVRKGLPRRD